ncbi:hypothetical protein [Tichowtungia aerotolerans]|uniref:Uncharacterized protein n=1 Tax=Tichowtungia aerotolerans TaxID=2697043 RepID=A0A6P1M885_9BACT|nr:hypothetical protein [Tichowtungia aerotolerans]QHI69273.1 hypothetical protein GT409_07360 [Tichowtungia aerotolerans]
MKKWIWIFLGVVLLSVAAVELTEQLLVAPKTVSSWSELTDCYYAARTGIPPIPSPVAYTDILEMMSSNEWDFLSHDMWSFYHSGGTLYVAEESELAQSLQLPIQVMVYEDLMRGEVVILGSTNGVDYEGLALFDAPEWMDYQANDPLEKYLMDELGPRRIVWSATLKSEAEGWNDLLSTQEAMVAEPMSVMTLSVPETITDFRIVQDSTNLSVNLPAEFAGATISLYRSTNLVEGGWSMVLQTNASGSGMMELGSANIPNLIYETKVSTNWVNCENHTMPGETCTNQTLVVSTNLSQIGGGVVYYRTSAISTNDADSDGLDNVTEYDIGTDFQDPDSDNDTLSDGAEIEMYGLNPLSADTDEDGSEDNVELLLGRDPLASGAVSGDTGLTVFAPLQNN